ncbi:MAG TPA: hypothetical protein VIM11_25160 [Tepidisphaeraceae bacterium]
MALDCNMQVHCISPGKSRVVAKPILTRFVASIGFFFAIFLVGCQSLPPGDLHTIEAPSYSSRIGHVYLIRGWRDLWSSGIDRLAMEMRQDGLNAQAFRAAQWRELADAIDRSHQSQDNPIVLIGFSYGADDAIEVSRRLHQPIDLLIAIDPVTPPIVPGNVRMCYDFYETNGFWDVFPWLRGIALNSDAKSNLVNIDLRKQREDLIESDTAHSNIAGNVKLHREIIKMVLAVCTLRAATRP